MPVTPDQTKRLLYAKHLLARASELQDKKSELLVAESLLILHDASEMVMQVVYEHHNIVPTPNFLDFWKKIPSSQLRTPPFFSQMRRLNDLRVGFKHRGSIPNPATVRALDADVRGFCAEICSEYLDTQLSEITLADLVEDNDAREHLKNAELFYADGKTGDALIQIAEAYHDVWQSAEKNGCVFVYKMPIGGARLPPHAITTWEPQLVSYLNLILLGVDLPTYSLFRRLTPGINRSPFTGTIEVQLKNTTATSEQFSTLLTFVTDLAISVQHRTREPIV